MTQGVTLQQDRILRETVDACFQTEAIGKKATECGYDIGAGFLPAEFADFSEKVMAFALERIRTNLQAQGLYRVEDVPVINKVAAPLIEEKLQTTCNVVPHSQVYYPEAGTGLINWLVSLVWPRA